MGDGHLKKSIALFGILLGSAVAAAALLPLVDFALVSAGFPFDVHRVFSRIYLVLSVVALAFSARFFGFVHKLRGQLARGNKCRTFLKGFVFGAIVLILLTLGALMTHIRVLHPGLSPAEIFGGLLSSLLTGVTVGFFETILTLGIIFYLLEEDFGRRAGAFITSLLYMVAHFLRAREIPRAENIDWTAGWKVLSGSMENLFDLNEHGFGMVGLFLLGIFFCLLFLRTGRNIYIVAGIHAGSVFIIKFNGVVLDFRDKTWEWLFGSSTGINSVAGWAILIIMILYVMKKKPGGQIPGH